MFALRAGYTDSESARVTLELRGVILHHDIAVIIRVQAVAVG